LVIAALISWYGWRWAALLLAIPAAVALILVGVFLSEPGGRGEAGFSRGFSRSLVLLIAVLGVRGAVFQGLVSFLPSFLTSRGFSLNASGMLTGLMLAVGVVAQPLGGILGDRISKQVLMCLSSVGLCIAVLLLHLSLRHPVAGAITDYLRVLLPLVGAGFCVFLTFPIGIALAADLTPGERMGTSVGAALGGGMVLPAALLPVVGYLVDHAGFAGAMMFLSAVGGAGAILSLGLLRRKQGREAVRAGAG